MAKGTGKGVIMRASVLLQSNIESSSQHTLQGLSRLGALVTKCFVDRTPRTRS